MTDALLTTILFAIEGVLDLSATVDQAKAAATDSSGIVDVPADPKPLSPAAQRALAEAEQRQRAREQSTQAASGTDQAS